MDMEVWVKRVLSNRPIVDQLLTAENAESILASYDEQKIEEIKICADILAHRDAKYSGVADLVDGYQVTAGHHPSFGRTN